MDEEVGRKCNGDRQQKYVNVGEKVYIIRVNGLEGAEHTWEAIRHFSRRKVLSYYNRKKLSIKDKVNQADEVLHNQLMNKFHA